VTAAAVGVVEAGDEAERGALARAAAADDRHVGAAADREADVVEVLVLAGVREGHVGEGRGRGERRQGGGAGGLGDLRGLVSSSSWMRLTPPAASSSGGMTRVSEVT
jgi:hypothetical protein